MLPYYLSNRQYYGTYDISDIIPLHNWDGEDENKYLVVISKNNTMIGTLTVEYTGDNIISAFREEYIAELNSVVENGTPFQLGYSNGCFMIYSNNSFMVVENPDGVDTAFVNNLSADSTLMVVDILEENIASAVMPRFSVYETDPGCTLVTNYNHPHLSTSTANKGLCWAACVASMAMQAGKATNLSAIAVYYNCYNSTRDDKPTDTYPIGTNAWIKFAFKLYGMTVSSKSSALSTSEVINKINSNKPIICKLYGETDNHAIVLWHCTDVNANAAQYVFMDPGSPSKGSDMISVVIDSALRADGTDLEITSKNGKNYSGWFGSLY